MSKSGYHVISYTVGHTELSKVLRYCTCANPNKAQLYTYYHSNQSLHSPSQYSNRSSEAWTVCHLMPFRRTDVSLSYKMVQTAHGECRFIGLCLHLWLSFSNNGRSCVSYNFFPPNKMQLVINCILFEVTWYSALTNTLTIAAVVKLKLSFFDGKIFLCKKDICSWICPKV